jgi:hypothetical protein
MFPLLLVSGMYTEYMFDEIPHSYLMKYAGTKANGKVVNKMMYMRSDDLVINMRPSSLVATPSDQSSLELIRCVQGLLG